MGDQGRRWTWRRIGMVAVPVVVVAGVIVALVLRGDDDATVRAGQPPGTRPNVAATSTTLSGGVPVETTPGATTVPPEVTTTQGSNVTTPTTTVSRPGARIQVKFADGSGIRLRDGSLVSLTGQDLGGLQAVLARYPISSIDRVFERSEEDLEAERAANEARTGQPQPDLNLYFRITLGEGVDAGAVIADLEGLAIVERAYTDPVAAPPPAPNP